MKRVRIPSHVPTAQCICALTRSRPPLAVGNMMLMAEVDADGKITIDDLIQFMSTYQ
jgi:hypothetical protein